MGDALADIMGDASGVALAMAFVVDDLPQAAVTTRTAAIATRWQ
jgi:hypothetical protein